LTGAMAGPAAGDQGCDGDPQTVDPYGQVTITRSDIDRDIVALRGVGQAARVYYQEAVRANVPLISRPAQDTILPSLEGYDPRLAVVWFFAYDCLLHGADGTRVELETSDPDIVRYYGTAYGYPDPTVETGNRGGFINVPADQAIEISAWRDERASPFVSRKTILAADGWVTSVVLLPGSEVELR